MRSSAAFSGTALGRLRALPPLDGMTVHGQSVAEVGENVTELALGDYVVPTVRLPTQSAPA